MNTSQSQNIIKMMEETTQTTPCQTTPERIKLRFSGIDLLRIIAIFLICMSHANKTIVEGYDLSMVDDFSRTFLFCHNPFGVFGNILFIASSCYFLVDKGKARTEKAINMILDSMTISITFLLIFLISGEQLDAITIVSQIFPDFFGMNWFILSYILFYLLCPIVIVGLKHFSKKAHFCLTILSLAMYLVFTAVNFGSLGSTLLQFFSILNIIAFLKWHCPSIYQHRVANLLVFIIGMLLTYAGHIGFNLLGQQYEIFQNIRFTELYSPFLVIALIALVNVFATMKFYNKFISYLSTCSLFVYLIHENYLLRTYTRVRFYDWAIANFGINNIVLYMIICGVFMFVVGFILAILYKISISKLTTKLSIIINNLINKVLDFFTRKME